jgi:hypothetical protein
MEMTNGQNALPLLYSSTNFQYPDLGFIKETHIRRTLKRHRSLYIKS